MEDTTPKQIIGPFGTLNNTDDPIVLPDSMAQDLLNVEITPQGKSVRKRKGLGLNFTLPISTSAVHGIYSFYDALGNEVSLFFNDRHLTSSVNGAAISTLFSTGTVAATWQCTDNLGFAYCASSARQPVIKTNGVTAVPVTMTSTGTMVAATVERLATAGFSNAPSQINFSGANDFSNWTLGGLVTSPYNETISAPGSRITHITYACNGLMWFKETSFGIILNPDDALAADNVILAPEIGTLDNTSVIYPGGLQFKSQDGHIYNYDCAGIEKLTRDITPTINAAGSRTSNSWTQTAQSDWQAGTITVSGSLSTTLASGDIVPSSFTATDTLTSDFSQGTFTNTTTYAGISVKISTNSAALPNSSFEDNTGVITIWDGESATRKIRSVTSDTSGGCGASLTGYVGSNWAEAIGAPGQTTSNARLLVQILDAVTSAQVTSSTISLTSQYCAFTTTTITAPQAYIGKRVQLKITATDDDPSVTDDAVLRTTNSFVLGGNVSFMTANSVFFTNVFPMFDWFSTGNSNISSGQFTSRTFDTGVTAAVVYTTASWTVNTSTPYLEIQHSTNGTDWLKLTSSTGTNTNSNRYLRYLSSFTVSSSENALSTLDDVSFVAKSTGGTFVSQIKNAPNLSSWDTLDVTRDVGAGTQTYYVRAGTNTFGQQSSTPTWTAITAGSVISASTGTFFQFRDDFTVSYPTASIALNDFTINWFEGTASDKSYGVFFGRDNAIWWSSPVGAGQTTNNRILRWDLINRGWVIYDIASNGFLIRNQNLYIGSSTAGKIYKFGDSDSDDGSAINSYWKSKDFSFDPSTDKEFTTISTIAKSVAASSMTITYTLDASSSTAYTLPLYNASSSIKRNNRLLPAGRTGNTLNVQFGNNAADQYWELFLATFGYKIKPWRVE